MLIKKAMVSFIQCFENHVGNSPIFWENNQIKQQTFHKQQHTKHRLMKPIRRNPNGATEKHNLHIPTRSGLPPGFANVPLGRFRMLKIRAHMSSDLHDWSTSHTKEQAFQRCKLSTKFAEANQQGLMSSRRLCRQGPTMSACGWSLVSCNA